MGEWYTRMTYVIPAFKTFKMWERGFESGMMLNPLSQCMQESHDIYIISELHPVTHHYWASVFYKHRAGFHFHSQQVRLSKHAASTSYGLPCQLLLGHRTFHRTIDPRIPQEDVCNCQFVPTCSNKTMGIWWKLPGFLILSCRIIGEIYPHVTLSHNIIGYQEKWLHNITQSHQNPERNQSKNWPKLVENTMPPKMSK